MFKHTFVARLIFFPVMLLSTCIALAQQAEINLKKQGDQMVQEFKNGNYAAFVKHMHPKVLQAMGGEAKLISAIKGEVDKWNEQDINIQSVSVGEVTKVVKAGTELHAVVPQQLVLKVPTGSLRTTSYLLAISSNKGEKWFFLDASRLDKTKLKKLFPNFNDELLIPAKDDPVFTRDE